MPKTAVEAITDAERAVLQELYQLSKTISELGEIFKLFDSDGDGYLTKMELGQAMRAMGQHPTQKQIDDLLVSKPVQTQTQEQTNEQTQEQTQEPEQAQEQQQEAEEKKTEATGPQLTDFNGFLTIMAKRLTVPEPDDQLLEAFRVFDKEGTGVISAADLRKFVTTMGERLTDEEVEEMIKEADDDNDGQVNYQEFTQLLIGP